MMKKDNEIKNPFRVPDNYFNEVNRKILDAAKEQPAARIVPFRRRLLPFLAAAASVAVLIVAGYLTIGNIDKKGTGNELSGLFVYPELIYNEVDLATIENNIILTGSTPGTELSNEEIIDFLVSDDIELSLIFEEI